MKIIDKKIDKMKSVTDIAPGTAFKHKSWNSDAYDYYIVPLDKFCTLKGSGHDVRAVRLSDGLINTFSYRAKVEVVELEAREV